eukprot:scaffold8993_cov207-Skeletonema_marinoi.AAC.23
MLRTYAIGTPISRGEMIMIRNEKVDTGVSLFPPRTAHSETSYRSMQAADKARDDGRDLRHLHRETTATLYNREERGNTTSRRELQLIQYS